METGNSERAEAARDRLRGATWTPEERQRMDDRIEKEGIAPLVMNRIEENDRRDADFNNFDDALPGTAATVTRQTNVPELAARVDALEADVSELRAALVKLSDEAIAALQRKIAEDRAGRRSSEA